MDQILWLIENYLPQKKDRVIPKKVLMKNLENETIKQFLKSASQLSKRLFPTKKKVILSFTFGNWAIPYLKLLKKLGIAK